MSALADEKLDRLLAGQEAIGRRLGAIEDTQQVMVRGMVQLGATLATHTEILKQIVEAATSDDTGGSQLHDALEAITAALGTQTELLAGIAANLEHLPALTADEVEARVIAAEGEPDPAADDQG